MLNNDGVCCLIDSVLPLNVSSNQLLTGFCAGLRMFLNQNFGLLNIYMPLLDDENAAEIVQKVFSILEIIASLDSTQGAEVYADQLQELIEILQFIRENFLIIDRKFLKTCMTYQALFQSLIGYKNFQPLKSTHEIDEQFNDLNKMQETIEKVGSSSHEEKITYYEKSIDHFINCKEQIEKTTSEALFCYHESFKRGALSKEDFQMKIQAELEEALESMQKLQEAIEYSTKKLRGLQYKDEEQAYSHSYCHSL